MRQTALDKAIENLEAKKADMLANVTMEAAALEHAILSLKAQKVKRQANRPRPVAPAVEKVG